MNMTVIDNRRNNTTTTFGDLDIGEAFLDEDGDFCIKTDFGAAIVWQGYWHPIYYYTKDDVVTPLEVTYSFTDKGGK